MAIDWDKVEEENKSGFKDYAPEGKYTTVLESVEVVTAKTGNTGIRFNLKETDDYKFPKYGKTFYNTKNDSWRQHHMKEIFVALGATEDQAKKAVEACEGKANLMEAYQQTFTRFLPKQKPFEIVVFFEHDGDKYPTWDFESSKVRLTYPEKEDGSEETDDTVEEAAEDNVTTDDLPF